MFLGTETRLCCHEPLLTKTQFKPREDPTMSLLQTMAESRLQAGLTVGQIESYGEAFASMIDPNINMMVQLTQKSTQAAVQTQLLSEIKLDDAGKILEAQKGSHLGPAAERALVMLTDSMYEALKHSIGFSLGTNLEQALNQTAIWQAHTAIVGPLTESLTNSIGALLGNLEIAPIHHSALRALTHDLTLEITPAITMTVHRALTRKPQDDHFCYYCAKDNLYCNLCQSSREKEAEIDNHLSYYSHFYSSYYSREYSSYQGEPSDWKAGL